MSNQDIMNVLSMMLTATAALLVVQALLAQAPAADDAELSIEKLRKMRREMANQQRRIIYNNDGCDVLYYPKDTEVTVENLLKRRTSPLTDTQVDNITFCPTSSGFSFFTHDTQTGTLLTRQPEDYGLRPDTRNIAKDLIDDGTDALQCMVQFAHEHDMQAFFSMRMNDTHDAAHSPDDPYFLYPPLKKEHPEWLVGNHEDRTPYGRWSSVDYAKPQIRDLAFEFVAEVCRNYDVDGIELDFFRHLCYFKSVAHGGTATDDQRHMMTDLMRRIREMTEKVGASRGRPILVSVRVPDSLQFCHDMGFDVETWLDENLFDILITTGYFRLNPWDYSVELGHKYDAQVYPCLSDSRVRDETRFHRKSPESFRGRAMNAWTAGADGILMFNYFNPHGQILREIGDTEAMATLDKLYFVTVRDGDPNRWLADGDEYRNTPLLAPSHPASIAPAHPLSQEITIGEDLEAARDAEAKVKLHLQLPGVNNPEQLIVTFNGNELNNAQLKDGWVDLPVPIEYIHRGTNTIEVAVDPERAPQQDEWPISWKADDTPQDPWHRDRGSERTEVKLLDDGLMIADSGEQSGDYMHYRYHWGAHPDEPIVVEATAKVDKGCSLIIVSNGVRHERLELWPDHIELWTNSNMRHEMDTTDQFHTYRIDAEGEDLKVFVDGKLRIDGTGEFKDRGRTANQLTFGAANSPMQGKAVWRSIRARRAGRAIRDLVVSVQYP